jgi:hypothetical protein
MGKEVSRREFLRLSALAAAGLTCAACGSKPGVESSKKLNEELFRKKLQDMIDSNCPFGVTPNIVQVNSKTQYERGQLKKNATSSLEKVPLGNQCGLEPLRDILPTEVIQSSFFISVQSSGEETPLETWMAVKDDDGDFIFARSTYGFVQLKNEAGDMLFDIVD